MQKENHLGSFSITTYNNVSSSNEKDICNMFGIYFQSNFVVDSIGNGKSDSCAAITNTDHLCLNEEEIRSELSNLKGSFKPFFEDIALMFLKPCSADLAKPLTRIFNLSLFAGKFLDVWKGSYITLIHKSSSKQEVIN